MNVTKLMRIVCEKRKIEQRTKARINAEGMEKTRYNNKTKKDDKRRRPIRGRLLFVFAEKNDFRRNHHIRHHHYSSREVKG